MKDTLTFFNDTAENDLLLREIETQKRIERVERKELIQNQVDYVTKKMRDNVNYIGTLYFPLTFSRKTYIRTRFLPFLVSQKSICDVQRISFFIKTNIKKYDGNMFYDINTKRSTIKHTSRNERRLCSLINKVITCPAFVTNFINKFNEISIQYNEKYKNYYNNMNHSQLSWLLI
jgi:hypothetical protein